MSVRAKFLHMTLMAGIIALTGFSQQAYALSCNAPKLATGRTVNVSGAQQFMKAYNSAKGGDVIKLAPGKYGRLNLSNKKFPSNVTIQSANPNQPAELITATLERVTNVTLRDLKFQNDGKVAFRITKPDPAVLIRYSKNINVFDSFIRGYIEKPGTKYVIGDGMRGTKSLIDFSGLGRGGGVYAISSDDVRVQGNTFEKLTQAGNFNYDKNVVISGNKFSGIALDVTDFGGVDNLLYEGNLIADTAVPKGLKHADLMQFRFESTNNIVIRNNIFIAKHPSVHGIYLGGSTTDHYRYKNVLIENNKIYGLDRLALAILRTDGLTIRNNTVLCTGNSSSKGAAILVEETSTKVSVTGNTSNVALASGLNWTSKARPKNWTWNTKTTGSCVAPPKVTKAPGCGK